MKWPLAACQMSTSTSTRAGIPRYMGRGGGDTRMWDMYVEYADIAAADEPLGRIKARLAALSAFAESQGLTGQAAFDGLRRLNIDLNGELMDTRRFSFFYRFVFFMCRERGQKSISVNTAVDAWRLALTGRFRLLEQWCAFVKIHQRHSISEDTWRQVLEFSRSVHEDLSNYDPEGAWPVLVDEFVDKMYSSESTVLGDIDGFSPTKVAPDDDPAATALASKATTLPGMVASAGSKRRRRDPKDDAAQVESVNSIAQLFAEMPSPVSCKRVRSTGCLVDVHDPMDEGAEQGRTWEPRESDPADDEILAGNIHGSPIDSNQTGSCQVLSSRITSASFPHWSKFSHRGLAPSPNVTVNTGPGSTDGILVCPSHTHPFESFH
ncbi:unnamed protein product [Calypogeia fissa]